MNYDEIVKSIMHGEKIFNLPLRVCYYARVSTDNDVPYLLNQEYASIETLREDRKLNKFIYNVYVESL